MSNERDELARLIFVADNWKQSEADSLNDWSAWTDGGKDSYTHRTADAILAAGYRKVTEDCDGSSSCHSPAHIEGCFATAPDHSQITA